MGCIRTAYGPVPQNRSKRGGKERLQNYLVVCPDLFLLHNAVRCCSPWDACEPPNGSVSLIGSFVSQIPKSLYPACKGIYERWAREAAYCQQIYIHFLEERGWMHIVLVSDLSQVIPFLSAASASCLADCIQRLSALSAPSGWVCWWTQVEICCICIYIYRISYEQFCFVSFLLC